MWFFIERSVARSVRALCALCAGSVKNQGFRATKLFWLRNPRLRARKLFLMRNSNARMLVAHAFNKKHHRNLDAQVAQGSPNCRNHLTENYSETKGKTP